MHAAHAFLGESLAIRSIDVDAVRRDYIIPKNSEPLKILHWTGAILFLAVVQLFLHFGDMDKNGGMIFPH